VSDAEVDAYASERLGSEAWFDAVPSERLKARIMATRAIDRLNFAGQKADEGQELQFPRGEDLVVPQDVKNAASEITIVLLAGASVEKMHEQQKVTARRYGPVSTSYDPTVVSEHLAAGIPSFVAWEYLKPYLADPNGVVLSRTN
jgi:hypothetical protein